MVALDPALAPHFPGFAAPRRAPSLLARWLGRRAERRALRRDLLRQPDSVLADFGLDRAAARREAAPPFWRA